MRKLLLFPQFNLKREWSPFFIVILGLLQLRVFDYFRVFNLKPDLLLAGVVILNLFFDWRKVFILSLLAGVFKDVFSAGPPLLNSALFPLWSFLIMKLSRKASLDNTLIRVVLLLIIAFLHNIISGFTLIYLGSLIPLGNFLRILFLGSFYTTFTGWVLLNRGRFLAS